MSKKNNYEIESLIERYEQLSCCENDIKKACEILKCTYKNKRKLLIVGNGGSASDSEHIMGELMKSFVMKKRVSKQLQNKLMKVDYEVGTQLANSLENPIRAISLVSHVSLTTAFMNDNNPENVYAQQLLGLGDKGDCLLAISTSGNSKNIYNACVLAKAMGLSIIGLTGKNESKISKISDVTIMVPETETYKVQELHLPVYHFLCLYLEHLFR